MTLVFVYGTLKRGGSNHFLLAHQQFVGATRTGAGFALYDLEGYPGLVAEPGAAGGICRRSLGRRRGVSQGARPPRRQWARASTTAGQGSPGARPLRRQGADAYIYLRSVSGRPADGA